MLGKVSQEVVRRTGLMEAAHERGPVRSPWESSR